MYATLSYDVNAGPERIEDVRRAIPAYPKARAKAIIDPGDT
jgi:hypothetical protein